MPWFSTWQFSGHLKMFFFFFPGFFVVFPVWNTLKHIEIWYRILWIDLIWAPEMKYELEATWYGRFLSKLVIQMVRWHQKMLWKYGFSWVWWVCQLGFTIKMRWYGAIFEGGTSTPFGPTVRFSVIAGFVASSIGPDGLHHPVQSNCGLWGGLDRCAMISQMTKVSFFFPKVIAQPARPMIDPSMSLRFMNLLSSHSWFMDVLLTPNMIIIGFDRSSPGNQLQDVSNGAGHSNEDPFDWSRC